MTIHHTTFPLDPQDAKAVERLRERFKAFWADTSEAPRAHYDRFIADTPMADGVTVRESTDPDCPGWWCEPAGANAREAILFIHGGGYVLGSAKAYRGFVSQMVARMKRPIFALEYPLSPEAQLPTALDLVGRAIGKLHQVYPVLGLAGDSAGGGLSLASLAKYPGVFKAAVVFSPWTDLSLSGASMKDAVSRELLLTPDYLAQASASYRGAISADDLRASPLAKVPSSLPPTLIQVGTNEILHDDSTRYAAAARAAGADVQLEEYEDMHHVFQLNVQDLATARAALDRACTFLTSRLT